MYRSGFTQNDAAPGRNYIINTVEPDMINVGWVKVSTNVATNTGNAANTWNWNVYKSPGANNSIAKDFFIALGWDVPSNSNVAMTMFEVWNSGTNTALGYPPNTNQTGQATPLANNWCNVNVSLLPVTPAGNVGYVVTVAGPSNPANTSLSPQVFMYSNSVTIDRLILATANTFALNVGTTFYGGVYDPFLPASIDGFPIGLFNFSLSTTSNPSGAANVITGLFTREPLQPGASYTSGSKFSGNAGYNLNKILVGAREAYTNKFLVSRVIIVGVSTSSYRGLLKDVIGHGYTTGSKFDTFNVTYNGVTTLVTALGPTNAVLNDATPAAILQV